MDIPNLPDALRTEEEIIATWKGEISKPLVSVQCITYNHATYIEDAIKGFLIQETDFPIEIWIHDDASEDGTREIVESYQKRYPRIIKTILQHENQYSQGIKASKFINPVCKGDYYAICEGDDCWVSRNKLASQVEALQVNASSDLCFHPAVEKNYNRGTVRIIGKYLECAGVVSHENMVLKKGGQIPTASILIRRSAYNLFYKFSSQVVSYPAGDVFICFFGSLRGGACYLDEPMSLYRAQIEGSWTLKNEVDPEVTLNNIKLNIAAYNKLDEFTGYSHSLMIKSVKRKYILSFIKRGNVACLEKISIIFRNIKVINPADLVVYFPLYALPGFAASAKRIYFYIKKSGHS